MPIASIGAAATPSFLAAPKAADHADAGKPSGKSHFHRPRGDGEVTTPTIATAAKSTLAVSGGPTSVNVLA